MPPPTRTCDHHDCPSSTDLAGLIRGDAPDDQLCEHVGGCTGCQERLDELACEGEPSLSGAVRHIDQAKPPSESAFWKALDRAETSLTSSYDSDTDTPSDVKLDFLQPSASGGRLGRLGQFEITRVIGRGGMGVVLHAFDPQLSRDVAVKILDPQLASNDLARQRFCREARAAAAVTHDNLVAVHQVNEDEKSGLPYLVMQLVNGESLEQRLRRVGKLSVGEAVRLGMQAAAGLAAAHATGLIHRDIKPGNILIEAGTDKVRLTDFGLARATEDMKLTRTGFVAGTPLYMAPEQARGDDIDHRVDLFSLGSVLYESLAGKPPFEGKTPLAVLRRVADEAHGRLRRVNPEVPAWLEDVVDRLLEKNPADRFETASEVSELFACRLSELGSLSPLEVPAGACAASGSRHKSPKARRHFCVRTAASLALVFVAGAVIGGVGMFELGPRQLQEVEVPARSSPLVSNGPAPAPAAQPDGPDSRWLLRAQSGAIWATAVSPDGTTLVTGIESGRISLWDTKTQQLKFDLHPDADGQQPAHKGSVWAVEFTPDGKQIISAGDDGAIRTWDAGSGKSVSALPAGRSIRAAAISPVANWVVIGDQRGTVQVFDLTRDAPVLSYSQDSSVNGVAFSPDGKTIASVGADGSLIVWQVPANRKRFTLRNHDGPVYGVAFSPDGTQIVTAGWDRTAVVWKVSDGTVAQKIDTHEQGVWSAQFAPCGKVIATAGQDGKTKVWDVATKELFATFGRHTGAVHTVRFDAKGSSLITGGRDGTVRVWDTTECKK